MRERYIAYFTCLTQWVGMALTSIMKSIMANSTDCCGAPCVASAHLSAFKIKLYGK